MRTKKVLAVMLVSAMMMGTLAGCGGNSGQGTETTKTATGSTQGGEATTEAIVERSKISVMTFDFSGQAMTGEYAKDVIAKIEDYTNTELDLRLVPSDSYEDKLSLTLASGDDMPVIITAGSFNANIVNNARAGAFWALDDYIYDSEKYPNLSQSIPAVNESISVDGKLYGVYRMRDLGRQGLGYRQDWADKLGLGVPETIDDIYEMMYQMTYGDPDGNGIDDTYGVNLCKYTGPLNIMQTWFGVGNGWSEAGDGSLVPVHMTPEYKEALEWFKKIYDEGLIAKDWAVRDTGTWDLDNKNGVSGMFIDVLDGSRRIWDYYVTNEVPSVTTEGEIASMNLVGAIAKEAGGEPKTLATSGYNGFFTITKGGAKTEAEVEAALSFLDKMSDDEMLILTGYGLEGIHWERDADGVYVNLMEGDDTAQYSYAGMNQVVPYIPTSQITGLKFNQTDRLKLELEIKKDNEKYAVTNPAAALLINSETYTLNGGNLDTIIEDARTQYIVGQIDDAGLQAAWDLWYKTGGEDVIKEVNASRVK